MGEHLYNWPRPSPPSSYIRILGPSFRQFCSMVSHCPCHIFFNLFCLYYTLRQPKHPLLAKSLVRMGTGLKIKGAFFAGHFWERLLDPAICGFISFFFLVFYSCSFLFSIHLLSIHLSSYSAIYLSIWWSWCIQLIYHYDQKFSICKIYMQIKNKKQRWYILWYNVHASFFP